jgi:hypothetical protein
MAETHAFGDRRRGERPTGVILARICAVIDLLVEGGMSEKGAAQVMARRMLAVGLSAPIGRHRTGWQRLLEWRAKHLSENSASDEVVVAYYAFSDLLDALPAEEKLDRVLDQRFWDRRRRSD